MIRITVGVEQFHDGESIHSATVRVDSQEDVIHEVVGELLRLNTAALQAAGFHPNSIRTAMRCTECDAPLTP